MTTDEFDFTDGGVLRKMAEEKLKDRNPISERPLKEADLQKLLHELQVHQIELEMQNDELKQAYDTAESALKKYTMLYDLAPIGFFVLEMDGTITDLNFTGADLLQDKRFNLVGSNFKLFVMEAERPAFNQFLSKVYASHSKKVISIELGYDAIKMGQVYMEGLVTGDEGKCLLSIVDVSRLKI